MCTYRKFFGSGQEPVRTEKYTIVLRTLFRNQKWQRETFCGSKTSFGYNRTITFRSIVPVLFSGFHYSFSFGFRANFTVSAVTDQRDVLEIQFLAKKLLNNRLAHPSLGLAPLPLENPGSTTGMVSTSTTRAQMNSARVLFSRGTCLQ